MKTGERYQTRATISSDRGIGLVEVAVAIIILGVLLVAFLPLVVNSVELAVRNTAVAQANQTLSSELQTQRNAMTGAGCTETSGFEALSVPGTQFTATRKISCDDELATLTINVASVQNGEVLATAITKVATG